MRKEGDRTPKGQGAGYSLAEVLIAALFVLYYSWDRFNVPTTNRSSTTAFRYFSGAALYSGAGLVLCCS